MYCLWQIRWWVPFFCTLHNDLRKLYIDNYYLKSPCMFKIIDLMTIEKEIVIRKLSNFAYKAFSWKIKVHSLLVYNFKSKSICIPNILYVFSVLYVYITTFSLFYIMYTMPSPIHVHVYVLTIGKCTFVGSRGSSLIDYVLASEDIFKCFHVFTVNDLKLINGWVEVIWLGSR